MNHPDITKAIKEALDELRAMPPEEFQKMLDEHARRPRCQPQSCGGSCQGMGWCYTCEDFRGELPDDGMEELLG